MRKVIEPKDYIEHGDIYYRFIIVDKKVYFNATPIKKIRKKDRVIGEFIHGEIKFFEESKHDEQPEEK